MGGWSLYICAIHFCLTSEEKSRWITNDYRLLQAQPNSIPAYRYHTIYGIIAGANSQGFRYLVLWSSTEWTYTFLWASLVTQMVKNLSAMWETRVQSLGQEIPQRREWLPTPVFLPGESHGQRSLVGYSPRGLKESDMTKRLTFSCFKVLFYSNQKTGICPGI